MLLELRTVCIEADNICIISDGTSHANMQRTKIMSAKDLKSLLDSQIKKAREKGIKIVGQTKAKQFIKQYENCNGVHVNAYNKLFDEHIEFWKSIVDVENKCIHDYEHEKCKPGYELRNQMMRMFYRGEPLDQVMNLQTRLEWLKNVLIARDDNDDDEGLKITLI